MNTNIYCKVIIRKKNIFKALEYMVTKAGLIIEINARYISGNQSHFNEACEIECKVLIDGEIKNYSMLQHLHNLMGDTGDTIEIEKTINSEIMKGKSTYKIFGKLWENGKKSLVIGEVELNAY